MKKLFECFINPVSHEDAKRIESELTEALRLTMANLINGAKLKGLELINKSVSVILN